ncbi:MAG: (deoxy)nucleoside triphosphate pyrophosphohydrolase [Clostridia bacterium]|nr:(deoxy)nucleoside triphosphate pyrophosphohydrolase [Clostridia bacterium]
MKEIHVVGAAIREGKRILAAQRSEKMSAPLKWEFAGGKVEDGEAHQEALKRELQEELGIDIQVGEHLATGIVEDSNRKIILHVYEASILQGNPEAKEHSLLKWIDIKDIYQLDWAEPDIPACEILLRRYESI